MAKSTFDSSSITRAQALVALDEPEDNQTLAMRLYEQMRAFGTKLQGGRRVRLVVQNDFEEVAAEALVKAVAEEDYDDDAKPPIIEIVRRMG